MITIEIMGGLGNQLFQVFALISYSLRYNFLNENYLIYFENIDSTNLNRPRYWTNFLKELRPLLKEPIYNTPVLKESNFHYTEIPFVNNENFKLFGYFQSYKYFIEYEKIIFEMINLKKQKEEIKMDCSENVSLHFRMGDYKKLPEYHPILKLSYYINSIERLIQETNKKDWNILYFYEKEDEEIVNKNINILKNKFLTLSFEPIDHKYKDYEQLLIMSKCKHNIIANSSFSWWGAYLNENKNKKVYYPNIWFGTSLNNKNTKDMYPPKWVKINETRIID